MGFEDLVYNSRRAFPAVGRILLSATFLDDGLRIFMDLSAQTNVLSHPSHLIRFPWFLSATLVFLSALAQVVGGLLLVLNKQITTACTMLLGFLAFVFVAYGVGLPDEFHSDGRLIFMVKVLAIVGGLLMLIADEKIRSARSSEWAGVPVREPLRFSHMLQAAGRILLAVLCLSFYLHGVVFGILGTVALAKMALTLVV